MALEETLIIGRLMRTQDRRRAVAAIDEQAARILPVEIEWSKELLHIARAPA